MLPDDDTCWRAAEAEDPRFDGWIFVGVTSTGIYCRPSCPARTPKRENVRFFSTAAAAQAAGFRACKRCRPDAAPGSPEWDRRADARRPGDAPDRRRRHRSRGRRRARRRLGYTERHLHRLLAGVVGVWAAGPGPLPACPDRSHPAADHDHARRRGGARRRVRLVRQFNATIREVFALSPTQLRARVRREPDIAARRRRGRAAPALSRSPGRERPARRTWAVAPCRVSSTSPPASTRAACASPMAPPPCRCAPTTVTSRPASPSTIRAIWGPPCTAPARCWTSTATRWPSAMRSALTRCSAG